jgi:hypothetical protein
MTAKNLFPTGDSNLDKLEAKGDPLERLICHEFSSLDKILLPYSKIWANHVYPRRVGDGALLTEPWQGFGGCHYTALVRLHHALIAKNKILKLTETEAKENDVALVLAVHAACATFWDNLGAAIDNFVHAKVEAKKALGIGVEKRQEKQKCPTCGAEKTEEKVAARTLSDKGNPKLFYAFERRHQFIHSILVPQQIKDGMIVFNLRHYDDAATDWVKNEIVFQNIDTQIELDWSEVLSEFGDSWEKFYSWLHDQDKEMAAAKAPKQPVVASKEVSHDVGSYGGLVKAPLSGTLNTPFSGSKNG